MKRMLILGLLLGAAVSAAPPPEAPSLASLVPSGTLLLAECDDLGGHEAWLKETALGRIWSEPELRAFLEPLGEKIKAALGRLAANNPLGLSWADLEGIRVRGGGFALVDVGFGDAPEADFVAMMQFRAGAEKAAKLFDRLREAAQDLLRAPLEAVEVAGGRFWRTRVQTLELTMGFAGDRFLIASRRERLEQVLGALGGSAAESLAASSRYRTVVEKMAAQRAAFRIYADVPGIYERVVRAMSRALGAEHMENVGAKWRALGMDACEALSIAEIPAGTGFRTELAVTMKERRGFWGLFQETRLDHRFARFAPQDALLYAAETTDLSLLLSRLVETIGAMDEEMGMEMRRGLGELDRFLGVSLEKELLAAVGPHWGASLAFPPGGGAIPDLVLFASVQDREKLERALQRLVGGLAELAAREEVSMTRRETLFRGARIHTLELGRRRNPIPVAPSWVIGEGYLALALFPQSLKHALSEKPSLEGNEAFRAMLRELPASSASCTYLDARRLAHWIYNSAVPLLQLFQGGMNANLRDAGFDLNFQDLPIAGVLTRHLSPFVSYTAVEKDCVRMGAVSSFGAPALLLPVLVIGAGAAFAYRGAAMERAVAEAESVRASDAELRALEEELARLEAELEALRGELEEEK
ncbi:MAG: hypothetical protein ACT4PV_15120 [Planctomycetaceae bacterium]